MNGPLNSVVLLSGGLDSSANLAFCVTRDAPMLALTVDYGQRAAAAELRAGRAIAAWYGVKHAEVALPWLAGLGSSALTHSELAMPSPAAGLLDNPEASRETAKAVWVPNRNGILIHVAAAYAESLGAAQVIVGFNSEEGATFPDNTVAYLKRVTDALGYSTATGVRAHSYTAAWDKTRIVRELSKLQTGGAKPFPWDLLWSCYEAGPVACGVCESCQRLARARKMAVLPKSRSVQVEGPEPRL